MFRNLSSKIPDFWNFGASKFPENWEIWAPKIRRIFGAKKPASPWHFEKLFSQKKQKRTQNPTPSQNTSSSKKWNQVTCLRPSCINFFSLQVLTGNLVGMIAHIADFLTPQAPKLKTVPVSRIFSPFLAFLTLKSRRRRLKPTSPVEKTKGLLPKAKSQRRPQEICDFLDFKEITDFICDFNT